MRWCTLCVILHLEALEEAENKEIVLRVWPHQNSKSFIFQLSLIPKPYPKLPQLPPHKPPQPPSWPQRVTITPSPKIPYLSDPSVPQLPHPHQNPFPLYTEPHPPTAQAVRVEGEEDVDAVVVAASVAGYWNESCKNGAAQTNFLLLLKRVVDKYFCHFLTFSCAVCMKYKFWILKNETFFSIFYYYACLVTCHINFGEVILLRCWPINSCLDILIPWTWPMQVICKQKWFFMHANNDTCNTLTCCVS